jgi:16S rRNA pseudouridine516 synthase
MADKIEFIFWSTLILYIVTLVSVPYVGVYLTYVAIPVIIISGLICKSTHEIELSISEGKYHQVKRMISAAGNRVEKLRRISVGEHTIPSELKSGEWRYLD